MFFELGLLPPNAIRDPAARAAISARYDRSRSSRNAGGAVTPEERLERAGYSSQRPMCRWGTT